MSMQADPTILDLMDQFPTEFPTESWQPQRAFLAALFGLPMSPEMLALYQQCTNRTEPPASPAKVATLLCGRRSGKSKVAALVALYLCFHRKWPNLSRGERGRIMIIACDKGQARGILDFINGLLDLAPHLLALVRKRTAEAIEFANNISIECRALSFRSTRGSTVLALLADEICLWRSDESAVPDVEVIRAVRPSMLTAIGSLLLALSSPYRKVGWAWGQFRDHYGADGAPLVWRAPTSVMNPTISQTDLDELRAEDPIAAVSELDAEFRPDSSFPFDPELVEKLTRSEPLELPHVPGTQYMAFCDPAGGSGDEMTIAVSHRDAKGRAVIDLVRAATAPFNPKDATRQFCEQVLKPYGLKTVIGDRSAAGWVPAEFALHGITYTYSASSKSELFDEAVAIFNQQNIELPPDRVALTQITRTERRPSPSGDKYDHPKGCHDDRANAIVGAAYLCAKAARQPDLSGARIWALPQQGSVLHIDGPSSGSVTRPWSRP
jgi:hypothetical protein